MLSISKKAFSQILIRILEGHNKFRINKVIIVVEIWDRNLVLIFSKNRMMNIEKNSLIFNIRSSFENH